MSDIQVHIWKLLILFIIVILFFFHKATVNTRNSEIRSQANTSVQQQHHIVVLERMSPENRQDIAQTTSSPATHITIPSISASNQNDHGMIYPGVLHMEPQLSPPPYTAVAFVLPPSYDEAIKQNTEGSSTAANSSREENKY